MRNFSPATRRRSYIFGGDTGLTYEDLKRRNAFADQMMQNGSRGTPRTAMEGSNSAAQSVLGALMTRQIQQQEQDLRLRTRANEYKARQNALSAFFGGGATPGAMASRPAGPYTPPSSVPQLDRNNPEAIAADTMGALDKKPRPQAIREGLIARGLPEHVADGFLMNMQDESGFDPGINERNPVVPGSRGGFGMIQWTGPRRKAIEAYAQQRGTPVDDLNTQLDFMMAELQGPERQAAQQILSTKGPGEAAAAIATHFLRPAEEHLRNRVAEYTGGQGYQTAQAGGMSRDMLEALSDPHLPDGMRSALGTLMQHRLQQNDPMRQLQMQKAQLELEQMRNPQPEVRQVGDALVQVGPDGVTPIYQAPQQAELQIEQLSDGRKYYVDPTGETPPRPVAEGLAPPPDDSAPEQQIRRIMDAYQVDRQTAVGIVDGVLKVSRDPVDDTIIVTNLANNEVVRPGGQEQPAPPAVEPASGRMGPEITGSEVDAALGVRGLTTNLINTIGDSIGLGQFAPGTDEAAQELDNLATRTVQTLSAEWPGRPSNLTREMLNDLTVRPNSISVGPGRARQKLTQLQREISRAIQSAQKATQDAGYTPQQRATARAALDDLIPLYTDYYAIILALEERDAGDSGLTPEDEDLIERYR